MTNQRIFFIRRMAALTGLALIVLGVTTSLFLVWKHHLSGASQTQVISTAKFTLTPKKWISDKEAVFHVEIESFQNPTIVDIDLSKTALLVDELDNPYKPKYWDVKKKTANHVVGDLVFYAGQNRPKKVALIIFTSEETQFYWTFK